MKPNGSRRGGGLQTQQVTVRREHRKTAGGRSTKCQGERQARPGFHKLSPLFGLTCMRPGGLISHSFFPHWQLKFSHHLNTVFNLTWFSQALHSLEDQVGLPASLRGHGCSCRHSEGVYKMASGFKRETKRLSSFLETPDPQQQKARGHVSVRGEHQRWIERQKKEFGWVDLWKKSAQGACHCFLAPSLYKIWKHSRIVGIGLL